LFDSFISCSVKNLFAAISLLLSLNSFAQDPLPMTLPLVPNATDGQNRKQGYWHVDTDAYGQIEINFYKNDVATTRFKYYSDSTLWWVCPLKNSKLHGELQYYAYGKLAQIMWETDGKVDWKKSIEITTRKLDEVTKSDGKLSDARSAWLLNVATFVNATGKVKEAEKMYVESFKIQQQLKTDSLILASNGRDLVDFYINNEMHNKALAILPEVIPVDKAFFDDQTYYYTSLRKLATCYLKLGRRDSAVAIRQKVRDYYEEELRRDSNGRYILDGYITASFELANAANDSTIIENMLSEGTAFWEKTSGSYNDQILDPAYKYYRNRGRYARAWELLNIANAIQNQIPDNPWYIGWKPDEADLYRRQKKYALAEKKYLEVLSIYEDRSLEKDGSYDDILNSLATVYEEWGKPEKARKYYEVVVSRSKEGDDVSGHGINYISAITNLGNNLITTKQIEKGEALLFEASTLAANIEGEDGPTYLYILNAMGLSYWNAGLSGKAEQIYLRVLDAYERNYGADHVYTADLLVTIGQLYNEIALYDKARIFLKRSMDAYELIYGNENIETGYVYNQLGAVAQSEFEFWRQRDINRAWPHLWNMERNYQKYLEYAERLKGLNSEEYVIALHNVGLVELYKGSYQAANKYFSRVIDIYDSLKFDKNDSNYPNFTGSRAIAYSRVRDFRNANTYFERSIQYANAVYGENSFNASSYYTSYGIDLWKQHNWKKAADVLRISYKLNLKRLEDLSFLTDSQREAFWDSFSLSFDTYKSFLMEYAIADKNLRADLFAVILNTKGQLFRANTRWKEKIRSSSDSLVVTTFREWETIKSTLATLSIASDNLKERDSLNARVQKLEEFLTAKTAYFGTAAKEKEYTWKDVKKNLKRDEAAIEIVRMRKRGYPYSLTDSSDVRRPKYPYFGFTDTVYYAALIVTARSKMPEIVLLKNGNEMERYGRYYRNMISIGARDTMTYKLLWQPFEKNLKDIKRIYLSVDGIYNTVNVNTLLDPKSGKYLLDEKDITTISTTRDLALASPGKGRNNNAVLIGRPTYENLADLPGSQAEIENINDQFLKMGLTTKVLLSNEASEDNVKKTKSPKVMHLATHGFFRPDTENFKSNPLVKSGLMLAGAKDISQKDRSELNPGNSTEDGILTAYEAMELDLEGTDLVVLSACETGLGEQRNGEGVYGLQRAFMVAGAESIIMSLWKVDDEATKELMTAFYRKWVSGHNKAASFKEAQLEVKRKYPNPVYWGGFVMVGKD